MLSWGEDSMIYITGDTHGDFQRVETFCFRFSTTPDDILIILGDAGINYHGSSGDWRLKTALAALPLTLFCLHGNHEQRPQNYPSYHENPWHGGITYQEDDFPNLIFAKDGEVYDFAGKKCIAIGGAYSIDKYYRLANNWGWWPDEQPSDEIKTRVEDRLAAECWSIDTVLSHTCPFKYEPIEVFLKGIDQSSVDKSTEQWLDTIEDKLDYKAWFCGHYHTNKLIDKVRFLFEDIRAFD
jgi:3-oxoacid CoA-transferase subunit A